MCLLILEKNFEGLNPSRYFPDPSGTDIGFEVRSGHVLLAKIYYPRDFINGKSLFIHNKNLPESFTVTEVSGAVVANFDWSVSVDTPYFDADESLDGNGITLNDVQNGAVITLTFTNTYRVRVPEQVGAGTGEGLAAVPPLNALGSEGGLGGAFASTDNYPLASLIVRTTISGLSPSQYPTDLEFHVIGIDVATYAVIFDEVIPYDQFIADQYAFTNLMPGIYTVAQRGGTVAGLSMIAAPPSATVQCFGAEPHMVAFDTIYTPAPDLPSPHDLWSLEGLPGTAERIE